MALWQRTRARRLPPQRRDIPEPPPANRATVHAWGEYEGGRCALSVWMDTGHLTYLDVYDGDHAGARCIADAALGPAHQVALSRVLGLWATDPGDVAASWQLEGFTDEPASYLEVTGDREAIRLGLAPYTVRLTRPQAVALLDALLAIINHR